MGSAAVSARPGCEVPCEPEQNPSGEKGNSLGTGHFWCLINHVCTDYCTVVSESSKHQSKPRLYYKYAEAVIIQTYYSHTRVLAAGVDSEGLGRGIKKEKRKEKEARGNRMSK